MVVVQLSGGLGNQLFQYAAGRALALRTGSSLKLDLMHCNGDAFRPYRLGAFPIAAEVASNEDTPLECRQRAQGGFVNKAYRKTFGRLESLVRKPRVIREKGFQFDPSVVRARGDVYLVGYWQSPKYFADAERVIRADFALAPDDVGADPRLVSSARQDGTVSLHIRRGDYVTSPETARFHGACSLEYYAEALKLLFATVEVSSFYVFSDDIEWAKAELSLGAPTVFVSDTQGGFDLRDFYLMSQCQHHVIANSSFSWWAAWLGQHPSGRVITPRRWFAADGMDTSDLRPPDWLTI